MDTVYYEHYNTMQPSNKNLIDIIKGQQEILEKSFQEIRDLQTKWEKSLQTIKELKSHNKEVDINIFNTHSNEEKICSHDEEFFEILKSPELNKLTHFLSDLLNTHGTKEPCNRFDVGNSIEFSIHEYITSRGIKSEKLPNEKRFDINIKNYKKLSIKYSSTGEITLHNSNGKGNTDTEVKDTLLFTPNKVYLITQNAISKFNIDINEYTTNAGDSLKLQRKFLKKLEDLKYPYIHEIEINHDKEKCENLLCSELFYKQFKKNYVKKMLFQSSVKQ